MGGVRANGRDMNSIQKDIVIAVTGVGAIIGQGIVQSLRASGRNVRIIGIDRNGRTPGKFMVDAFEQKPEAAEDTPEYLMFWELLLKQHGVTLVLPGLEVDMLFLDKQRKWFRERGCALAMNRQDLIRVAGDKWEMNQALAAIEYPIIPSCRPASWSEAVALLGAPPLLLKPIQGNGSRGIAKLEDAQDFAYWSMRSTAPWMLQRIVGTADEEFTVGVFGLGDGGVVGPIIFRRRLSGVGNTLEAEVVKHHPVIEHAVARLCTHFHPLGPTNLQFRLEGDIAYLLEINPRFSSSNSLRTAFGFNEAAMCIDFYLEERLPAPVSIRTGLAWRYFADYVTYARDPL